MNDSFRAGEPREADEGDKNARLLRFAQPSSLDVRAKYASLLGISGAPHPGIFEQLFGRNDVRYPFCCTEVAVCEK